MGVLDRFFLVLYTLAVLLLSVGAIVLCTQLVPFDFVWTNFMYLCGRWETGVGAAVFFLLSLRLLKVSLSAPKKPRQGKEAVIVHGEVGDIQVAVDAVKNLVDKTARGVKGVRDVKVQVAVTTSGAERTQDVQVKLKIVIGQESNVVAVSDQVRDLVKASLADVVGLETFAVEVLIDDISNAPVRKQRVV